MILEKAKELKKVSGNAFIFIYKYSEERSLNEVCEEDRRKCLPFLRTAMRVPQGGNFARRIGIFRKEE